MKFETQLQQDVIAELTWEPSVHATQIGVEVKGSDVIQTGCAKSGAERLSALHAVWSAPNVLSVTERAWY